MCFTKAYKAIGGKCFNTKNKKSFKWSRCLTSLNKEDHHILEWRNHRLRSSSEWYKSDKRWKFKIQKSVLDSWKKHKFSVCCICGCHMRGWVCVCWHLQVPSHWWVQAGWHQSSGRRGPSAGVPAVHGGGTCLPRCRSSRHSKSGTAPSQPGSASQESPPVKSTETETTSVHYKLVNRQKCYFHLIFFPGRSRRL